MLQGARRKIRLDTASGHAVDNEQDWSDACTPINYHHIDVFRRAHPLAEVRTGKPTGIYNCHGLVFGSRRTMISDSPDIRRILEHDAYRRVPQSEVLPGDVVLYIGPGGDIEHSAVVVTKPDELLGVVRVYSKWGIGLEYFHSVNDSPYDCSNLEFYRVER